MKNYVKDYPRPQLIRNKWENLNGAWKFAFDDENAGEAERWFAKPKCERDIIVPFTYETKMSCIGDESVHENVWYFKTISCGEYVGKDVLLHFEGSDYVTKVWVNGEFIGTHRGGYSRFSFDITKSLKSGENTVAVKVEDSIDRTQPRGKQRWQKDNFACWYVQTTGIWKTVWLEYAPKNRIEKLKLTPEMLSGSIGVEAEIHGTGNMKLLAKAFFDGHPVGECVVNVRENRAEFSLCVKSLEVDDWDIRKWSPNNPNLYDLELELLSEGEVCDKVLSYFGMREIAIKGNKILLNGVELYQRLILDQGYWKDSHLTPPSEEALITDIDKIMALGYNGVRKHMKVEDERFLLWADMKGLLVWSEFPATYVYNDTAVERIAEEWMQVVRQNYSHPSIITWTPFNESWGVPDIVRDKKQQSLTQAIYYMTKAVDSMRPVVCNDGWEHTISDIITLHDYVETGEEFLSRYSYSQGELLGNEIQHNKDKFPFADGFEYNGQPVIISEFGGIAFNNGESGWGYGNKVVDEESFIDRFADITGAIKALDYCCGYCYTQVTDVQQEINGLMDIERNFKIKPEVIRKINLK